MELSQEKTKIVGALLKAKKEFSPISKDKSGYQNQYQYISFESIIDMLKEPFDNNELMLVQDVKTNYTEQDNQNNGLGKAVVSSMIIHSSGEYIKTGDFEVKAVAVGKANAIQCLGSAITYAKRYQVSAMLGIAADVDDDGFGSTPHNGQGNQGQGNQGQGNKGPQGNQGFKGGNNTAPKATAQQLNEITSILTTKSMNTQNFNNIMLKEVKKVCKIAELTVVEAGKLIMALKKA